MTPPTTPPMTAPKGTAAFFLSVGPEPLSELSLVPVPVEPELLPVLVAPEENLLVPVFVAPLFAVE